MASITELRIIPLSTTCFMASFRSGGMASPVLGLQKDTLSFPEKREGLPAPTGTGISSLRHITAIYLEPEKRSFRRWHTKLLKQEVAQ